MLKTKLFRVLAVIVPGIGVLLGLPLAEGPFSGDPRGIFGPYMWLALPVYVALAAAPGYLACVLEDLGARASSVRRRWWVRVSLLGAVAVSLVGLWGASLMVLFGPPAVATLVIVVVVWVRFEAAPSPGDGSANHPGPVGAPK